MKLQRIILAALLIVAAIVPAAMTAKNVKLPKVYMFGFAASFNDTIVHFTDVQAVDSVWMDSKTHFLLGRENYSNMLRNYLDLHRHLRQEPEARAEEVPQDEKALHGRGQESKEP